MADQKIYVGNGKKISTKFGDAFKISLSKKDINTILAFMKSNALEWCNLEMMERKEPDKYGKTHWIAIDTWKPEPKNEGNYQKQDERQAMTETQEPTDDLPF
jgi:hypothetical protein